MTSSGANGTSIVWSSSNAAVVSESGIVTPYKGKATIV
ncbi:MAG: immunoglobulin-like domain-containing protein [Paenibacillaceae bacterium]